MKSINHKWTRVTNPSGLLLTNSFVNYYEGISVLQTASSPAHVLPSSYVGKIFHINNQGASTESVTVTVNVQGGPQVFSIEPGDSAIFVHTGSGVWDQTGGEDVIRQIFDDLSIAPSFSRLISFNTPSDIGNGTYIIGSVPPDHSVTNIVVEVAEEFDDSVVDTLLIQAAVGPVVLMPITSIDIKQEGIYTEMHWTVTTPIEGVIHAVFNDDPNANGGTQGTVGITVNYTAI
jgi:hypothetical protein